MAESNNQQQKEIPIENLDAKWDACLDLSIRRVVYSSVAGAFTGLLLFRSPATRWASLAFGAGCGIGSAYSDCSRLFEKSSASIRPSEVSNSAVAQDGQE